MDYKGQHLAELMGMIMLVLSAIAAFVYGYMYSELKYTLCTFGAGTALTTALVVPDYPWFRKNPLRWQIPQSLLNEEPAGDNQKIGKKPTVRS
mmetsp:Transcript_5117/g.14701  ORF Transcript_5117/g.14701 Transcript_5117/m.14701 type:complete len:93 (-) Transcript_5117:1179-1457(-)